MKTLTTLHDVWRGRGFFSAVILCLALTCGVAFTARAQEEEEEEEKKSNSNTNSTASLEQVLNADGTIRKGAAGSFNPAGYKMQLGADCAPRFVPADGAKGNGEIIAPQATCGDNWDNRFSNNDLNATARAIVVSGSDVYVGGDFVTADNVIVSRVARWNGSNWSPVGNGFGAGVNALALSSGGILYAGGSFTTLCNDAACSSTTAGYNRLAQWNGTTWGFPPKPTKCINKKFQVGIKE